MKYEYTSAQANKLLKKLMEERDAVLADERQSKTFIAATTESLEDARPAYDYAETQARLAKIEADIRTVKHCLNIFNTTHTVEGFDMTADEMLVYIPQLSEKKSRLGSMANTLPKSRITSSVRSTLIEYQHANYDVKTARSDHEAVSAELAHAQLALDQLNHTELMTIELDD